MKKKIAIVLIICMILLAAGCGEKSDESASAVSAEAVQPEKTETSEESKVMPGALNVEGDTFTIDELAGMMGAEETDVRKLLGIDQKSESYDTKLFGEDTVITLSTENDIVKTITLAFEKTDLELLTNAVAEQMGQDGEKTDDTTKWTCEGSVITLTQTDKGCVIEINK